MTKQRKTVSLDPEVAEWLNREGRNGSETVNKAVKQLMATGGSEKAMLELRKDQLTSRKEVLQGELETINRQLRDINDRLDELGAQREKSREERIARAEKTLTPERWLSSVPRAEQIPAADSQEMETVADEFDMDATELRKELVERVEE